MFLARRKVKLSLEVNSAVSSIYGIGSMRLSLLRQRFGRVMRGKLSSLHLSKRKHITRFVDKYSTAGKCKRVGFEILRNLVDNGTYKGIRMQQGLPANGQRSHSNASTCRRLNRTLNLAKPQSVKGSKKSTKA